MPILPNAKHERFAQGIAKGLTADEAYEKAGYSAHRGNASRMSANEYVVRRVEELQERAVEKTILTKQWVIERLIENVERSMQAVEITREGKGTGEYKYDGAVANRALELLGKEKGMFIDRSEVREIAEIRDTPLSPEDRDREWIEAHGALQTH